MQYKCEDYACMTGTSAIETMISDIAVDSYHTDFSNSLAVEISESSR